MTVLTRQPNTQECVYFGRKLSNVVCDSIESNADLCIGSENDDSIYFDVLDNVLTMTDETVKERVFLYVNSSGDSPNYTEHEEYKIDLEDLLKFAAENCNGIYKRVLKESEVK